MVNIKQALSIIKSKEPKLHPTNCVELSNIFCFFMVNSKNEPITNGCTYCVDKKNGKAGWKSLFSDGILSAVPVKEYSEKDLKRIL